MAALSPDDSLTRDLSSLRQKQWMEHMTTGRRSFRIQIWTWKVRG